MQPWIAGSGRATRWICPRRSPGAEVIRIQAEDFDVGAELARMTAGRTDVGGLASFVGLVRENGEAGPLRAMTLEPYPGMTEKPLGEIEAEAVRRWPLSPSPIIHPHGRLLPGERNIPVATACSPRPAAL